MTEGGAVPLTHRRLSPGEVALAGLDVLRREPGAALAWAGVSVGVSVLMAVAGALLLGPDAARLSALPRPANPSEVAPLLARMAPGVALLGVVLLAFYAVMNAAMYRATLRPQERGWRRMRLGADELRQAGVLVWLGVLLLVVDIAIAIVAVILSTVVSAAVAGAGAWVRMVAILLALLAIWVVGVRLSLAGPVTFQARRVSVLESWRLTRGAALPLFGAYLLAFVLLAMLTFVVWLVTTFVTFLGGGAGLGAAGTLWGRSAGLILGAAVFPFNLALTAGPTAAAYARLATPTTPPGGRWPGAEREGAA